MIFDAPDLPSPVRIKADVCVIGSGPGGAAAAMVLSEAGARVVVLEAGEFLTPADMTQREEEMFPKLYWDAGGRATEGREVKIHQGRGVGGSSLHNLNLCKRIPASIRAAWARDRGMQFLTSAVWDKLYEEVESLLSVSEVPRDRWNRHNLLLEAGVKALGWKGGGLSHNRSGCIGSGFCEVGCAYDAKNNAAKVLIPRAVKAGADVIALCQAITIRWDKGRVRGVDAVALDKATYKPMGRVIIDAERVCVSASATATAALLLRSKVPDPSGETGKSLRVHPAVVVAGDFEEPVKAWQGIPQTYECTEHLNFEGDGDHKTWIVPAFAHPVGTATLIPGHGQDHRSMMRRYSNLAALTAMVHDDAKGTVAPKGDLGLAIRYWPSESDLKALSLGLYACAELLFAAGAKRVFVPMKRPSSLASFERGASIEGLRDVVLKPGDTDITAVHPMASVPMGDDPKRAAVDSRGKHHHLEGLFVADGSLFPTSIGVPPQLSIYAMGLHVGRWMLHEGW